MASGPPARAVRDVIACGTAGGDDGVVAVGRHADEGKLLVERGGQARRIGQQHDRAMLGAEAPQRLDSRANAGQTVMHHAPDVADQRVIVAGDLGRPE